MAIIKCKMCGGDLILTEGSTIAECEYCGSRQTVPIADNEKKMNLFARANRLRANNEFDKAAGVYESIVTDFPEEAEAYWGLILCRYGIEYVDDPATGKKIPTCHCSSFDSVMDDQNFELVMEYADPIARRVYREEAKQIEALRKGIIEVSSHEEPYDIFICYKETDENGQRTLDSVLAQDVYDMLTENGYRVFFSRVSLEDKLGVEYEPYIFAALNSAKIMLAFGTDYDYYNAVWVKNEWSRFLQLIARGEKKTLIPCYKNIDAYDVPKEFAKLQAQDLGKVGASQDLLRGIKKILPKEQPKTETPQQAIIQQAAASGPSVLNLLRRGEIFLEEKNWSSAGAYFNKVLDIQAENGNAYLGLALANAQCPNLDAFVQKRSNQFTDEPAQKLQACEPETERIEDLTAKLVIPGYYEAEDIRKSFEFNRTYSSREQAAKENKTRTLAALNADRNYSRAKQYADAALREKLAGAERRIETACDGRIKKAGADAASAKATTCTNYRDHLEQQTKAAQAKHEQAALRRDSDTQAKREAEKKAKTKRILSIAAVCTAVLVLAMFLVIKMVIIPASRYKAADRLLANEKYEEAASAFEALGDYRDSSVKASAASYQVALKLLDDRQFEKAVTEFEKSGDYKDSSEKRKAAAYKAGEQYISEGNKPKAAIFFGKAIGYQDARERSFALWDEIARREVISTANAHTVGVKSDGTVVAVGGSANDKCNVSGWRDIVAVSTGQDYTIGLKADGTVVATPGYRSYYYGQCDVSDWTDIVAVSTYFSHTVGLKADGTVVSTVLLKEQYDHGQCDVSDWEDIVAISAGDEHTVGLKTDGTVVATKYTGKNYCGQCDVSGWSDIVAVAAGYDFTVGLKADGTVVAVGRGKPFDSDITSWHDIVAVSAGAFDIIGVRSDGTAVVAHGLEEGKFDVSNWQDIVAVSGGSDQIIGLKADGTVVATTYRDSYYAGQCEVSDWSNIKLPKK